MSVSPGLVMCMCLSQPCFVLTTRDYTPRLLQSLLFCVGISTKESCAASILRRMERVLVHGYRYTREEARSKRVFAAGRRFLDSSSLNFRACGSHPSSRMASTSTIRVPPARSLVKLGVLVRDPTVSGNSHANWKSNQSDRSVAISRSKP